MNDISTTHEADLDQHRDDPLDEDLQKKRIAIEALKARAGELDTAVRRLAVAVNEYANAFDFGGHADISVSLCGPAIKEMKIEYGAKFPETAWGGSHAKGHNMISAITEAIRRAGYDAKEERLLLTVTRG